MSSPAVPLSSQQGESSRTSQKHRNETGEASPNNGRPVSNLNFDNLTLRSLPIDPEQRNFVRQVPNACFSLVKPTPVVNPKLVMHSESALKLVDMDVAEVKSDDFVEYFSGNRDIPGAQYAAHCYCGHQFGHFSGQLGDGATMYIGEIVNSQNERWEIQFKGAGKTPYSRSADGRKVLRSSMREFMCSELMHSLGIPTTRAGTVVTSDTKVVRDIFYSGDPIHEPATIITRIAPTFLRFGSFEIFKPTDSTTGRTGPSVGNIELLRKLTEFTIQTYYPHVWSAHSETEDRYYYFYREVCERTARLVAEWQSVGWCHGVLNTDNMSIVGVTIDYGPFGFVEHFDPNFICNDSDDGGRYTYAKQPQICRWNCMKLGESLAPILPLARSRAALIRFDDVFNEHLTKKMNQKLGLVTTEADDEKLVDSLFTTLEETAADFTNTFRCLSSIDPDLPQGAQDPTLDYLLTQCAPPDVCGRSGPRIQPQQLQMLMMLARSDPGILRQLGMSLEDLQNEIDKAKQAEEAKSISPDEKTAKNREIWSSWLSVYRSRLQRQASQVSATQRRELMDSVNPRYVLRNYIAQKAIDDATAGNYSTAHSIFKMLSTPFKDQSAEVGDFYDGPPHNRAELRVT